VAGIARKIICSEKDEGGKPSGRNISLSVLESEAEPRRGVGSCQPSPPIRPLHQQPSPVVSARYPGTPPKIERGSRAKKKNKKQKKSAGTRWGRWCIGPTERPDGPLGGAYPPPSAPRVATLSYEVRLNHFPFNHFFFFRAAGGEPALRGGTRFFTSRGTPSPDLLLGGLSWKAGL